MLEKLLDIFFPHPSMCIFCGEKIEHLGICPACEARFERLRLQEGQCQRCGSFGYCGKVCDTCRDWASYYKGNQALYPYTDTVREMIVQMKFHEEPWRLEGLTEAIEKMSLPAVDVIVPVPLHPKRLRERGYNQSLLLANLIGRIKNLPVRDNLLKRIQHTAHQSDLPRSQRLQNVAHAFSTTHSVQDIDVVLLVDDVLTTGATLVICARQLHQAGVKEIYSMTIAAGIH